MVMRLLVGLALTAQCHTRRQEGLACRGTVAGTDKRPHSSRPTYYRLHCSSSPHYPAGSNGARADGSGEDDSLLQAAPTDETGLDDSSCDGSDASSGPDSESDAGSDPDVDPDDVEDDAPGDTP